MKCKHKKVTFFGIFSMIGHYVCDDCGVKIDPVERAKQNGDFNIALLNYYKENPNKMKYKTRIEVAESVMSESLGYFIQCYTSADKMPDPEMKKAFAEAKAALDAFEALLPEVEEA